MPASTSRTPSSTFAGVTRLTRPSSSTSPQSPQVEPSGRRVHRFATSALLFPGRIAELAARAIAPGGRVRDAVDEHVSERRGDVARGGVTTRLQPEVRVVVHAEPRERCQARVDVAELARLDAGL